MTTAIELFREALSLTNSVGQDQQLTAQEAQDCLSIANDRLEEWSTQSLAIYGLDNQTFSLIPSQGQYTIGPGGDWNTVRPIRINEPAYTVINGVSFPCVNIPLDQYNLISVKGQQQQFPFYYVFLNENPLAIIKLWPVPSTVLPITFSIDRVLTSLASLTTVLSFPPGYKQALKYQLAVDFAPMFGRNLADYPTVVETAKTAFGNIKRANQSQKKRVMRSGIEYSDANTNYGTPWDWMIYP